MKNNDALTHLNFSHENIKVFPSLFDWFLKKKKMTKSKFTLSFFLPCSLLIQLIIWNIYNFIFDIVKSWGMLSNEHMVHIWYTYIWYLLMRTQHLMRQLEYYIYWKHDIQWLWITVTWVRLEVANKVILEAVITIIIKTQLWWL